MSILIAEGQLVRYGFRLGRVVRLEARDGQDGALVAPEKLTVGDGWLPHWVPLTSLSAVRSA